MLDYKELINNYFIDKKMSGYVADTTINGNFITYKIFIDDIKDFKKFNNAMQKELMYLIGKSVEIKITNAIYIVINTREEYKQSFDNSRIVLNVGKDTQGNDVYCDFKSNPHWLIGGSTGSGKSVFLNNVISELISNYENFTEFLFIDLKKVEFYKYNGLKTNVRHVANDMESALQSLDTAIEIMNERYEKYQKFGVLDIDSYNDKVDLKDSDRYLFVVIDELAELMLQNKKEVMKRLQSILQLGRASGVYCLCATQRPSTDVISGVLKVNFTTKIAFKVSNRHDSATILGSKGAENLIGNGDGLIIRSGDFEPIRFQGSAPTTLDITPFIGKIHNKSSMLQTLIKFTPTFMWFAKFIWIIIANIFVWMFAIGVWAINFVIVVIRIWFTLFPTKKQKRRRRGW